MRVIPGNNPGDERGEVEARLLALAARCVHARTESEALQGAVEGIATTLDVGALAVVISPQDGSLKITAWAGGDEQLIDRINDQRIALSADGLVSAAVMSATWIVQRDGGEELRSQILAAHPEAEMFSASAAVPLIGSAGTLGVFVLYALRETAFSARHMEACMQLGSILAADFERRARHIRDLAQQESAGDLLDYIVDLDEELTERAVIEKTARYFLEASTATLAIAWRLVGNRFVAHSIFGNQAAAGFAATFTANADANMPIGQGPLGRSARSGEFSYVKDALADRSFTPWMEIAQAHGFRSVLALPLLRDPKATFVVELYSERVDAFSEGAIASMLAFLPHAQNALRNALEAGELRVIASDRAVAVSAAGGISRSLDEAEVVRSIARAGVEALGASFAIAYLQNSGGPNVAGGWNAPAELSARLSVSAADPAFSFYPPVQAMREGRYTTRSNVTSDSAWIRLGWEQLAREHGFNAVSAFPLLSGGRPIGAVALFFAERAPSLESEEEIVRQLGLQGGAAIEAARKYEQAKSARNFLDRILEESNDAIVQFDLHGNVVSWNKGAERIFGMARDEALGKLFYELPIIPPDRREDIRELLSRVSRGEQVHVFEVECRSSDGGRMEVLLSAAPARDQHGKIVGLVAFSKDISEQKKQLEQLARQNRNLAVIRDVIRALGREVGVGPIASKGLEKLLEVLHLEAGRLYVYDAADRRLHNVAARGFGPEGTEPVDVHADVTGEEGPLATAFVYRQTMLTTDAASARLEHPYLSHRSLSDVTSILTKPLTLGEEPIGAVQVFGLDGRRFSSDDQSIFHAVGEELAVALRHARMLDETTRMAITDPLTGLYNYRFTQDVLRKRLSEARRRKRPLSVVMVDVDGLAEINEREGREFGDQVLRQFGNVLVGSVRISDIVARYGGDEFIVLLPETQLSDAVMLAERMAARIAQTEWPVRESEASVTASLGVASFPEAGSQMQMLLKAADAALYRAKQAGRNTVHPRLDTLPRFAG